MEGMTPTGLVYLLRHAKRTFNRDVAEGKFSHLGIEGDVGRKRAVA